MSSTNAPALIGLGAAELLAIDGGHPGHSEPSRTIIFRPRRICHRHLRPHFRPFVPPFRRHCHIIRPPVVSGGGSAM